MKKWLFSLAFLASSQGANAEIMVTGSYVSDFYALPAVTVAKQADFLIQKITVSNDSRSSELRRSEIIGTINNLLKSAKQTQGIELSHGDGFLVPIKRDDDSLKFEEDSNRTDSNYVEVLVKIAFNPKQSSSEQIGQLRRFIEQAQLVSRTMIETNGDIALSMKDPEQYRYEILEKIAAESRQTQAAMGSQCSTTFSDLQNRVQWERTALAELTLYIAYMTEVQCQ